MCTSLRVQVSSVQSVLYSIPRAPLRIGRCSWGTGLAEVSGLCHRGQGRQRVAKDVGRRRVQCVWTDGKNVTIVTALDCVLSVLGNLCDPIISVSI